MTAYDVLTLIPLTAAIAILLVSAHHAGARRGAIAAVVLWWAAATSLSAVGPFGTSGSLGDTLGFALVAALMTVPIAVGILLRRRPDVATVLDRIPLPVIVGVQAYRIGGLAFLVAVAEGTVSRELGVTTTVWDLVVAVGAVGLALALLADVRGTRRGITAWSVLGIADFVVAVTVVLATFPFVGIGQLVEATPAAALGTHPLAFVAILAVPLSVLLHLEAIHRVRLPETDTSPTRPADVRALS